MVIIIDDKEKEDISKVTMSDDGTGAGIRIPAVLIGKNDGEKIIDWITHASEDGKKQATVKASFLTEFYEDGHVVVNYWYTAGDDRSMDFIRDVSKYVERLSDIITWEPRFVTWACPHCDEAMKKRDCVSDGKYCAMKHNSRLKVDGKDIIMENLR